WGKDWSSEITNKIFGPLSWEAFPVSPCLQLTIVKATSTAMYRIMLLLFRISAHQRALPQIPWYFSDRPFFLPTFCQGSCIRRQFKQHTALIAYPQRRRATCVEICNESPR